MLYIRESKCIAGNNSSPGQARAAPSSYRVCSKQRQRESSSHTRETKRPASLVLSFSRGILYMPDCKSLTHPFPITTTVSCSPSAAMLNPGCRRTHDLLHTDGNQTTAVAPIETTLPVHSFFWGHACCIIAAACMSYWTRDHRKAYRCFEREAIKSAAGNNFRELSTLDVATNFQPSLETRQVLPPLGTAWRLHAANSS